MKDVGIFPDILIQRAENKFPCFRGIKNSTLGEINSTGLRLKRYRDVIFSIRAMVTMFRAVFANFLKYVHN